MAHSPDGACAQAGNRALSLLWWEGATVRTSDKRGTSIASPVSPRTGGSPTPLVDSRRRHLDRALWDHPKAGAIRVTGECFGIEREIDEPNPVTMAVGSVVAAPLHPP